MLSSILAYLPNARGYEPAIHASVELAVPVSARVHGLTVLDTRDAVAACSSETAVFAHAEFERLGRSVQRSRAAHAWLTRACDAADLQCDVKTLRGDPRELVPREAQFHDLAVAAVDDEPSVDGDDQVATFSELADLTRRGVHSLLVVRGRWRAPDRVLLAYDGSETSGRVVRSFFHLGILPTAECRLLVVGPNSAAARDSFDDMADYCRARRAEIEMGWTVGSTRQILPTFAKKWRADLVVARLPRGPRYVPLLRDGLERLLQMMPECALLVGS